MIFILKIIKTIHPSHFLQLWEKVCMLLTATVGVLSVFIATTDLRKHYTDRYFKI